MIYEHRTYYILPGKMAEHIEAFGTLIPVFAKHGAKMIGAWQTSIGNSNEFVYILGFENLSAQEKFWVNFRQDEKFKVYAAGGVRNEHVANKILKPVAYSPLQ